MDEKQPSEAVPSSQAPELRSGRSPLHNGRLLEDMLREQGEDERSIEALVPVLERLSEWQAPVPSEADTQRLLSVLLPLLPVVPMVPQPVATPELVVTTSSVTPVREVSEVRAALRDRLVRPRSRLRWFFELALLQGMMVRPSFWLASAFITVLGMLAVVFSLPAHSVFVLRLLGPLLAALGVSAAFRSVRLNMLEIELSCPISPLRLTLVRLTLVLGYDVALGLLVSLTLVLVNAQAASLGLLGLVTVRHWLAPLLLVAGLALILSLRLPVETAAALAYTGWLAVLVPTLTEGMEQTQGFFTSLIGGGEVAIGIAGTLLVVVALSRIRTSLSLLLPRG